MTEAIELRADVVGSGVLPDRSAELLRIREQFLTLSRGFQAVQSRYLEGDLFVALFEPRSVEAALVFAATLSMAIVPVQMRTAVAPISPSEVDDDQTWNVAAAKIVRIMTHAKQGQILVEHTVAELCPNLTPTAYAYRGPIAGLRLENPKKVNLRGVGPTVLYELRYDHEFVLATK